MNTLSENVVNGPAKPTVNLIRPVYNVEQRVLRMNWVVYKSYVLQGLL